MKPIDGSSGVDGTLATRNTPRSGSTALEQMLVGRTALDEAR
jgi:hypothetical protein